jgi:hypothetical protein
MRAAAVEASRQGGKWEEEKLRQSHSSEAGQSGH